MQNHVDKIAVYTNPEFGYKWLMKITSQEKRKCVGDFFKHIYFSGDLMKIDENDKMDITILDKATHMIQYVRLKNLEFVDNPKLKELFD